MVKHVIFLNAPPRAGKDTFCKLMAKSNPAVKRFSFADYLKTETHRHYGLKGIPPNHFEKVKDVPTGLFGGLTPREAYIKMSEEVIKPTHGSDFFGRRLLDELKQIDKTVIAAITDSGFRSEAIPIIKHYGLKNITIVQIYREGCSFVNDSRDYWSLSDEYNINLVNSYNVINDGSIDDLQKQANRILKLL